MKFTWKRSVDPKAELRALVGDYELPSFSGVAVSTLGLLRDDADLGAVAERIMTDPGLSVRILRTVNSAAFGMRQEVTNLQYATSLLGRSRVEALVLAAAVGEALPSPQGLDLDDFWRTSARRACLAKAIAARISPAAAMESFTGGLLQDMAIPLLAAARPDEYLGVLRTAEAEPDRPLRAVEAERLGYDHAQVGAVMAEAWNLPETLITAIADHHRPGERAPRPVEAVALVPHGHSDDGLERLRGYCTDQLGVQAEAVDGMVETASSEAVSLAESMTGSPAGTAPAAGAA